jgi:hypothetical protein
MKEYNSRIKAPNSGSLHFGVSHYITILRDPLQRYISEYEHVHIHGAVWSKAIRTCKNLQIYKGNCSKDFNNTSWIEFLDCDYNLAHNRQVRMLADFNLIGCTALKCWSQTDHCIEKLRNFNEQKILHSAKHSLLGLAFFGLAEHQKLSEYLFLKTFGEEKFRFSESIIDIKNTNAEKAIKGEAGKYIERIKSRNHLDIELYEFAKEIFFKRVAYFQKIS